MALRHPRQFAAAVETQEGATVKTPVLCRLAALYMHLADNIDEGLVSNTIIICEALSPLRESSLQIVRQG